MAGNVATKKVQFWGTGRRKRSTARVRLMPGNGKMTINDRDVLDYFGIERLRNAITQPLSLTDTLGKYDIICKVRGGGISGQAGAVRLGIARALIKISMDYKVNLKRSKCLTRDSREKERKKYGLKKARKAPQFSKR